MSVIYYKSYKIMDYMLNQLGSSSRHDRPPQVMAAPIANTPTASSPPTETEEEGNEPPPPPILPPEEPIEPLPPENPQPPNTAQFYSADRMRRAVSEFILDNQDNQRLINLLNNAPDNQYPLLRSVISLPFPVVLEGTPIPQPTEAISAENAALVTQLARWGKGSITEVAYSPDGNQLAIATLIGIYSLTIDMNGWLTLVPRHRFFKRASDTN